MCAQVFKWRTLIFSHIAVDEDVREDVLEVVENAGDQSNVEWFVYRNAFRDGVGLTGLDLRSELTDCRRSCSPRVATWWVECRRRSSW